MKKLLVLFLTTLFLSQPCFAWSWVNFQSEERAVEKLLESQVKYANRTNFDKFIKTFDPKYKNSDGFNLDIYSSLVKDIWSNI